MTPITAPEPGGDLAIMFPRKKWPRPGGIVETAPLAELIAIGRADVDAPIDEIRSFIGEPMQQAAAHLR